MYSIRPVILCGGSGKRLWPVSRESYPKQFSKLVREDETMLQTTIRRLLDAGAKAPILIGGNQYRFILGDQLASMNIDNGEIFVEPKGRNTAPAVAAAALHLEKTDPGAIMVVSPADHSISDETAFATALETAIQSAVEGHIVTFGIVPDRAETGYGYIELATKVKDRTKSYDFVKFLEKPDANTAQSFLDSGKYLWNSGVFVFSVRAILEAFQKHAPQILSQVKLALNNGKSDLDFFRLADEFSSVDDLSIDYAIMEHIEGKVVPLECGWNDLGSWQTVHLESPKDENGNATIGSVTQINCKNSLIRAESSKMHVVGIGLENISVVAMRDAVLVANMTASQSVSDAVTEMRKKKIEQAEFFPRDYRPWGWFETLTKHGRFQVKSIVVKPGQKLSLQSHVHRAEHWIVVEGTAKVTIDDEVKMVSENESVYIPLGAIHRMENPGRMDLHLIEVQTGSYLEEDDIIRYEDVYARE